MRARRIIATLLVWSMIASGPALVRPAGAQPPPPPAPPAPGGEQTSAPSPEVTPARVSYIHGQVSFWRPGGQDWTPATLNTPLAPGDVLYTAQGGDVEIQVGPGAFVRATGTTQIGIDNQEADFIQLRVTGGQAALDLRQLAPGTTVELDTPNAAFTVNRPGYYRVDVDQDSTSFGTYRGGSATLTAAGGAATPIAPDQQVVIKGTDSSQLALGVAPPLAAWDNWNFQRTDYLLQPASTRYVSPAVYGTEELTQYGSWRPVETYGSVWVPSGMPAGWVPYSTGRWIWDSRFGWSWLDDAPWGWAPYHYGRWVFIGNYWAWAPGPIITRPAYAPALVVFLGGATLSVGRPLCWAPLGWGEPIIPWWGRRGFVGVPSWGGWGGPRIVNNVVINRNTTINVTNITVYRNVHVTNAVVAVPVDRFGHGHVQVTRVSPTEVRQLTPVRGPLEVRPVAISLTPATGPAVRPPGPIHGRAVVATRAPEDFTPTLRAHGLAERREGATVVAPRLVPSPTRAITSPSESRPGAPGARKGPGAAPGEPVPPVRLPEERKRNPAQGPGPSPETGAPKAVTLPPPTGTPTPAFPEPRRGNPAERPAPAPAPDAPKGVTPPPPTGTPTPAFPEPRRGNPAERPVPAPPAPAAPKAVTLPPPTAPPTPANPELRRGHPAEQPAPPAAPSAPKAVTIPQPPRAATPMRPAEPPPAARPPRLEPPSRVEQPERGERPRGDRKEPR